MSETSPASTAHTRSTKRRFWLIALGFSVVAGLIAWSLYWFLVARFYETTNDAYVSGHVVTITSREPATVVAVHADNTQSVRRGQLLVELDPARAEVAMRSAEADLALTIRNVRAQFSKVAQYEAEISAARVQLAQTQEDFRRRQASAEEGQFLQKRYVTQKTP
ncbi:MAG: biotin/lipoyl-binding protein [Gammaproteobacteria bacterium]